MALTIETGAIVAGADSYVTRADFIAYALTTGLVIADEQATDDLLVEAFYYLNSLEATLLGERTAKTQPNAYPRCNLVIEDYSWDSDEIPRQVILAQELITIDLNAGVDIYNRPQSVGSPVKVQRVEGVVSRTFAISDQGKMTNQTHAMAVIRALQKGGGMSLAVSRG